MNRVVDKFMDELRLQVKHKKVEISISDRAREWLAGRGHDPGYGARPLARLIQTEIKDVLSEEVLFGKLFRGGKVYIDVVKDRLTFDYS